MKFLSEAWVQALVTSLSVSPNSEVTLWYHVTNPDSDFWLALRSNGTVGGEGKPANADLTFSCDHDTMQALSREELLPQAAFMQGKLEITGDMTKLIENKDLIATLGPAMASLESVY